MQDSYNLEEESKNLATSVLAASLVVIHDAHGGGEDYVAELDITTRA